MERRKWPDIDYYRWQVVPLGEDEHGLWVVMEDVVPMFRHGEPFDGRRDGVRVVPWSTPWCAWFAEPGATSGRLEQAMDLYVDIIDEAVRRDDGSITMVDLDFDVVRYGDGRVELIDQDEFVEHRLLYGYPDAVADAAVAASRSVLAAVEAGVPPFDGEAARRWAAIAGIDL